MAILSTEGWTKAGLLAICAIFLFIEGNAEVVQMKIVDEITNYGYNFGGGPDSSPQLSAKVKPSNFSGPSHLKVLKGQCFSLKLNEYKYKFCPFDNVTQHEQTYRWNPYSGILGIWKEWYIVNNTFHSMLMANGDSCGSETREAEVVLSCGRVNNLTAVSEPKTCSYRLSFQTPLVCHEDSRLVYPRINKTLQKEWDNLEQELHDGEITTKGYDFFLKKIFWKAGLVSNPEEKVQKDDFKPYESLDTCNEEYKKLLEEVQRLRKSQTAT